MTFMTDLAFGEKYQQELINILKPKKFKIMKGKFKEYDLIIYDIIDTYYEVKADRMAHKTNNICIEYECNGKASGITTTTSDYYAYFIIKSKDDYNLYIVPVSDLKQMIKQNKYSKNISGGDRKKSNFYLFSTAIFNEYRVLTNSNI